MADFATPTFYLVLEKQRRDREGLALQADQSRQRAESVISGTRYAELIARFGGTGDDSGDRVEPSCPISGLPVRAGR